MIAGAATVILWRNGGWWGLYEMVPGFAAGCLATIGVSLLDRPPAASITNTFYQMLRATTAAAGPSAPETKPASEPSRVAT
jgi:sodium/proline symporter